MPTTKQPDLVAQIGEVDAKLRAASEKWIAEGKDPKSKLYAKDINGLLDRRARLMEKRDGRKLLIP